MVYSNDDDDDWLIMIDDWWLIMMDYDDDDDVYLYFFLQNLRNTYATQTAALFFRWRSTRTLTPLHIRCSTLADVCMRRSRRRCSSLCRKHLRAHLPYNDDNDDDDNDNDDNDNDDDY